MPHYRKRKNKDGSKSILTLVRVKGFKASVKTFKNRDDAEAWAVPLEKELREKAQRGGLRSDVTTMTLGKLIEEYLGDPNVKALDSFECYHGLLDWWAARYSMTKVMDFSAHLLRDARQRLTDGEGGRKKQRAPATVNRHLSVMRAAWNWGQASGLVPMDRGWPRKIQLTEPRGRIRFLSDAELANLLKEASADVVMHPAILLSLATGIRQGEMMRLKWAHVDLDEAKITLHETKNDTPRTVYVPSTAVTALRVLKGDKPDKVDPNTFVFVVAKGKPLTAMLLRVRWERIRERAELVDFKWHDLRHSCASFLAKSGASLLEIGSVLGHKSQSMSMRYSHLVQGAPVRGHLELDALLGANS